MKASVVNTDSFYNTFLFLFLYYTGLVFLPASYCQQAATSKGKEFWAGFMLNRDSGRELAIYIAAEKTTHGTVSIPGQGFSQNFSVGAGQNIRINIPIDAAMAWGCNPDIENKGIYITAEDSVYVFALNRSSPSTDATLILPVHALGVDYYVMTEGNEQESDAGWGIASHQCIILATQDQTVLEITPSTATCGNWQAGQTYTLSLNRGEIFRLRGINGDLTGTRIRTVGCGLKPFAVFAGHVWTQLGGTGASDHLFEQMIPITAWGKSYVASPVLGRTIGDIGKVLAAANNTEVKIGENPPVVLHCGQSYTFPIPSGDNALAIQANKPILVGHFNKGEGSDLQTDPFFILLSPIELMPLKAITVAAISIPGAWRHAVNIITHKADTAFVSCSAGTLRWFPTIGNSNYYHARLWVPSGNIRITSSRGGFVATVCGHKHIESYGYAAGISLLPNAFRIEAPTKICQNQALTLKAFSDFPSAQTTWELEPGVILGGNRVEYTFKQPGVFNISARMRSPQDFCPSNTEFCLQHTITVLPAPKLDYEKPKPICQGQAFTFSLSLLNASASDQVRLYYRVEQEALDSLLFDTEGKAVITISSLQQNATLQLQRLVNTLSGCTTELDISVPITVLPLAKLPAWELPRKICLEKVLTLEFQETIPGLKYFWEIHRGDNLLTQVEGKSSWNYTFLEAGTYRVLLRVEQPGCNQIEEVKEVEVIRTQAPRLVFQSFPLCSFRSALLRFQLPEPTAELGWTCEGATMRQISSNGEFELVLEGSREVIIQTWQRNSLCTPETLKTTLEVFPTPNFSIATTKKELCPKEKFIFGVQESSTALDSVVWFCLGANINKHYKGIGPFEEFFDWPGEYQLKAIGFFKGCSSDVQIVRLKTKGLPTATFEITPKVICLQSQGLATYKGPIGMDCKYLWQCADCVNNLPNAAQVPLQFNSIGLKTVSLQIEAMGCTTGIFSQTVLVRKPVQPQLDFSFVGCSSATRIQIVNPQDGYRYQLSLQEGKWFDTHFSPSITNEKYFIYDFQEPGMYELKVAIIDSMGCPDTLQVNYSYQPHERLASFIPTIFTPNGDGLNDFWGVEGPLKDCLQKLYIYDRRGRLVFSTSNPYHLWDGTVERHPATEGTYIYTLELMIDGKIYTRSGVVTLLR
ncbi:MAG: gliding motility-associated C-terminal domain-containing protein [Bacteroidia bacterium]|nr:gliding motility-associated C-terminal domain-containing protein [Bacteroidia bacterium]MDW8159787.1 gliding motility-associated C-terminal domain-containing protein [Bacteroidia bacterium]